jgi:hypothetical protein
MDTATFKPMDEPNSDQPDDKDEQQEEWNIRSEIEEEAALIQFIGLSLAIFII